MTSCQVRQDDIGQTGIILLLNRPQILMNTQQIMKQLRMINASGQLIIHQSASAGLPCLAPGSGPAPSLEEAVQERGAGPGGRAAGVAGGAGGGAERGGCPQDVILA